MATTRLDRTADGSGGTIVRRRTQRDMPLATQQARRHIEPDPAGAGNVDLGPGVKIGEVVIGAFGTIERYDVRLQLDEIA